jgi:hypothetical protein
MKPAPKLLDSRPLPERHGSLLGFVKIQFSSGLILDGIGVHFAGSRSWASPPSRPSIKGNAVVVNEVTGKPFYTTVVDFSSHGVRSSWNKQVLKALRQVHPELFEAQEVASPEY